MSGASNVTIRILTAGDEPAAEAFLRPRMDESMFLLANMRQWGLVDKGERHQGAYAGAFDGAGRLIAMAAHYRRGNIITQAPTCLADVVRAAVEASGYDVKAALGPDEQVRDTLAAISIEQVGDHVQVDETETLYALRLSEMREPPALRDGHVTGRRIAPEDESAVAPMLHGYRLEALGETEHDGMMQSCRDEFVAALPGGRRYVLERGGKVVATTAFNAVIDEAVQVGGVYTPPADRGKGYGRCAVAASLLDMRQRGAVRAILFTGDTNRPARRAYESLGFQPVGRYRVILLRDKPTDGT